MEGPTGGGGGGKVRWTAGHTGLEGSWGPSMCLSINQRWFSRESSGKDKYTTYKESTLSCNAVQMLAIIPTLSNC